MEGAREVIVERILAGVRGFLGINNSEVIAQMVTDRLQEILKDYLPVARTYATARLIEVEGEVMARLIEAKAQLIKAEASADLARSMITVNTIEVDTIIDGIKVDTVEIGITEIEAPVMRTPTDEDVMRALNQLRGLLAEHFEDYEDVIERPLMYSLPPWSRSN